MSEEITKPWGSYRDLYRTDDIVLKTITVNPKSRLSLQSHSKRNEFWVVVKGNCICELNDNVYRLHKGDRIQISVYDNHRLINDGILPCEIVELQYGELCDEDDILRLEDDYSRINQF